MNTIVLTGCTTKPLANYLKCLGVFRLVGEQIDPTVRLAWKNGAGCLQTALTEEELIRFFLETYAPSPILAPWNGGSGFYKESGKASAAVQTVESSTVARLDAYRRTIAVVRRLLPDAKPKEDDKTDLLFACRAELPDEVLPWLDACFVLGQNRDFFPLLGSGANDGNLEFASNFIQRLPMVFALDPTQDPPTASSDQLRSALFGNVIVKLSEGAFGQFSPGAIGGPNATQNGFEGESQVNPWDYVLMMEGCLMFAGAFSRRNGSNSAGRAAFPFTVRSVAVGYGSSADIEETSDASRSELWLPLWSVPFTLAETRHLLSEGRAQIGRRQARNSVEFALALNLLGVSRGVDSFERFGFLKRNGLAFLATPLGNLSVGVRPQARLLEDRPLVDWLDSWRRATQDKKKTPNRYLAALRGVDRAIYEFATRSERGHDAPWLQNVLRAVGRLEWTAARAKQFTKKNLLRPLQRLSPQWIEAADDHSPEFRLAVALASIVGDSREVPPLRAYIEPVQFKGSWAEWNHDSPSAVWSTQTPSANLAHVFLRRHLEAARSKESGAGVPLNSRRWAHLADVLLFLSGGTDDLKLVELLWGLLGVDYPALDFRVPEVVPVPNQILQAFGCLRLLVEPLPLAPTGDRWELGSTNSPTRPDPQVFHLLQTGRRDAVQEATTRAAQRLLQTGHVVVGYRNRQRAGKRLPVTPVDATRLLASMLFPLSKIDLGQLANSVLFPPAIER